MVKMIQTLLDKGNAYVGADGSIYFRIASFPTYGRLANLEANVVRAGASGRVQSEEYDKAEVADFALWKAWVPEDGAVFWEPEFEIGGTKKVVKGRPGWHIECSVMASALLGDRIDLHLGGEDLVFPHHQNEIAQSEAATGKQPFVKCWLHRRFLLVDGAKMSKSRKNFFTLQELVDREGPFAARGFRYLAATAHYRKPIDFTLPSLRSAMKTLRNLDDAHERLRAAAGNAKPSTFADGAARAFKDAMEDDLETSAAMAAIHGLVHEANQRAAAGTLSAADAASALAVLGMADRVLGLGLGGTREREPSAEQKRLLADRERARQERRFQDADRLRKELHAAGIEVKDTKAGQEWSFL
jgi:cysteinyl-tRNA synthetase